MLGENTIMDISKQVAMMSEKQAMNILKFLGKRIGVKHVELVRLLDDVSAIACCRDDKKPFVTMDWNCRPVFVQEKHSCKRALETCLANAEEANLYIMFYPEMCKKIFLKKGTTLDEILLEMDLDIA